MRFHYEWLPAFYSTVWAWDTMILEAECVLPSQWLSYGWPVFRYWWSSGELRSCGSCLFLTLLGSRFAAGLRKVEQLTTCAAQKNGNYSLTLLQLNEQMIRCWFWISGASLNCSSVVLYFCHLQHDSCGKYVFFRRTSNRCGILVGNSWPVKVHEM